MQALRVVIPGKFYDSQIYDGRLYLWNIDGSLTTVNWDLLVEKTTSIPKNLNAMSKFVLQRGDDLYSNSLMQDADIRDLIQSKLKRLSELTLTVEQKDFLSCVISQQDSPLPFPHADSVIHYKTIYAGGQSGVSASKCDRRQGKYSVETTSEKLFDLPVFSLSASNLTLAVAGGYEGLFDYSIIADSVRKEGRDPRRLSDQHCNFVRWLYPSIFGSSYFNKGYFADFKRAKRDESETRQIKEAIQPVLPSSLTAFNSIEKGENRQSVVKYKREFQQLISPEQIFSHPQREDVQDRLQDDAAFTWGVQDKICLATKNSIKLVKYTAKINSQKFKELGSVPVPELNDEIISADSSFFGVVIEKDTGLLIISSSLESQFLSGEPVNWRVFPKSRNYTNQLHVIYDDAIHIYCFTHDYFVDQATKKLGISVNQKKK